MLEKFAVPNGVSDPGLQSLVFSVAKIVDLTRARLPWEAPPPAGYPPRRRLDVNRGLGRRSWQLFGQPRTSFLPTLEPSQLS